MFEVSHWKLRNVSHAVHSYIWIKTDNGYESRKRECVCENCGKTFTATRKDVKYCCDDCRANANRWMQKERNAAKQIKENEPVLLDNPPIKENGQEQKTA